MAKALGFSAVAVAASLAGCSPFGSEQFKCTADDQCGPGRTCNKADGADDGVCTGGPGPGPDGGPGDSPAEVCYGDPGGLVRPCFPAAPTGIHEFDGPIDTTTSTDCIPSVKGAVEHCVIAGEQIRITGPVTVTGSKALVLVATDTITITGTLDAASKRNASAPYVNIQTGAGAASLGAGTCNAPTTVGIDGGGAGGTFVAKGGKGAGIPGTGESGEPQTTLALRGGCPGQNGAGAEASRGAGGQGGGALYLIANAVIDIKGGGRINASGEGGHPGLGNDAGGGGGGSGGLIGLDAPTIMNAGIVFANGASGGEGADSNGAATAGFPGPEPNDERPSAQADGGCDGGAGGAGGAGGSDPSPPTGSPGVSANFDGGGGGGGGTGVIKTYRGVLTGKYSPTPTP